MSLRRPEDLSSVRIFFLPGRLEHVLKMFWKTKNHYDEDVFKTSPRYVLITSLKHLRDQQIFAWSIKRPSFSSLSDTRKNLKEHGNSGNIFNVMLDEMNQFTKIAKQF